jgi:hypothetical protein
VVENHESGDTVNIYGWIEPLSPTVNVLRAFSIASREDFRESVANFRGTGRRLTRGNTCESSAFVDKFKRSSFSPPR